MTFQEMIESLYNLTGDELRALAWEALLISDGPDAVHKPNEDGQVRVDTVDGILVDEVAGPVERRGFVITAKDGWETGINTMPDTPIKEK
jgi:hypothetical protein